ncbi:MAG: Mu transposase C-terminal domain-containing protein [Planctomycetota bacterium]|nr:Mu transposase C-terminal domain-containing protein [Planctomycetota bacterium]
MWKPSKLLKVGQNGVAWQGLRYGVRELSLLGWLGKEVCLRIDPNDVSRVTVCTPEDRIICVARASQRLPFLASQAELRKAIAEKRRGRKVLKEYHEQHPRLHEDLPGLMIEARAEENRQKQQTAAAADRNPGPTIKPIQTAMNDQLPALRRALKAPTEAEALESIGPNWDLLKESAAAWEADREEKEAERYPDLQDMLKRLGEAG